ncbi:phage baseplate assembly protein V [Micromonospora sp. NPDC005299]|uniref:phage baseplate assembly protein V n=1 Tax=Micromonospora sp. NPDC005299 TaxID=3364231 RepID=UPI0036C353EC
MIAPPYAPRFDVRISGVTMAAELADHVLSLTVETDLDLAGTFAIVLHDAGSKLLDSPLLDVGRAVEIHLGYGNDLAPAFLGEIASIEPSFPADGPPTIRVTGYDMSYRMRRAQPEPTEYSFMNDSVIATRIAAENGLLPMVDPTPGLPKKIIQVESDFAFLKSRAQQYFFDVYVEWDRLHFQFPRPQLAAHVLEWGCNLTSFSPRISAAGLAGLQVIRGYSQELAQSIYVMALAADFDLDNLVERLGSSAMDLLGALVRKGVHKVNVENPLDAAVLARSLLANLLEGMYEGMGSCIGLPELTAGRYITVRGVGRRFGGTYRVRKVTHRIDGNGFRTDFSITQRGHSSLMGVLRKQVVDEPPPDRAEKFYGVVLAEVMANAEVQAVPPEMPIGRVKVSYPGLSDTFTSGWAPCVRPMATTGAGFFALPEVGDQVLVAFEHGDLSKPYVLGALWTAKRRPPVIDLLGTNAKRVLRSTSGHTITLDDTKGMEKVTIEDKSGSSITLNSLDGSMSISAKGELTISAGRDLTLEAFNGVTAISMTQSAVDVT